jgi:hypothetical protein
MVAQPASWREVGVLLLDRLPGAVAQVALAVFLLAALPVTYKRTLVPNLLVECSDGRRAGASRTPEVRC